MSNDIKLELKINKYMGLGIIALISAVSMANFVSIVDSKSAGGIIIEKETMDIGSVVLRIDDKNPADIYGGTWELIKGDANLSLGDGSNYSSSSVSGENEPVVPLVEHNHVATSSTDTHHHLIARNQTDSGRNSSNLSSSTYMKFGMSGSFGWTAYALSGTSSAANVGKSSSDSHNHSITVNNAGVSNAKLNVRGARFTVNVWKRIN